MISRAVPTVKALMESLIDFAGLFPPASLTMSEAVAAYDYYRRGPEAFALGLFVVPAERLREFGECLAKVPDSGGEWRLSVITTDDQVDEVERFEEKHRARVIVDAIETKVKTVTDIERYGIHGGMTGMTTLHYLEIPLDESVETLVGAMRPYLSMRAKLRTGGVTAGAFPSAEMIVRFLIACRDHSVAFKATAGLHHPLRGDYRLTYADDSNRATMYGFLNVFLTALFLEVGCSAADAVALLNERDITALQFTDDAVTWHGFRANIDTLTSFREHAASFGSCSFREPVDELQTLGLL
jgi:hypothetical protein